MAEVHLTLEANSSYIFLCSFIIPEPKTKQSSSINLTQAFEQIQFSSIPTICIFAIRDDNLVTLHYTHFSKKKFSFHQIIIFFNASQYPSLTNHFHTRCSLIKKLICFKWMSKTSKQRSGDSSDLLNRLQNKQG